jgi:hypothetical protein
VLPPRLSEQDTVMSYSPPTPSEMFSDTTEPTQIAGRFEALKTTLASSHQRTANKTFLPKAGPASHPSESAAVAEVMATKMDALTKGLDPTAAAGVQAELDAIKSTLADLGKDWTTTAPNANGLVPYDLEAPAKLLVPRMTPLRNRLPRNSNGKGLALHYKRITGWSNSGTGGVADQQAFFSSESDTASFGPLSLRRPQKISYASDDKTVAYMEQGLSDLVTWKAEFAGRGFQDIRSASQMALLWASMGAEERALLYARGTSGNGFTGAVAAPTISASIANTGGTIPAGTYRVVVTARTGSGESVVSNEISALTTTGTGSITFTVTAEPVGALGYNAYVTAAGGGVGTETYQASFVGTSFVLTAVAGGGAAAPVADTSANSKAYDGLLTVQADPTQSGYVKRVNAALTSDAPFQDAFAALFGASIQPGGGANGDKLLANPDEVWVDGNIQRKLGDYLTTQGSSNYRIALTGGEVSGGTVIGSFVTGIVNKVTGKMLELGVHPYMPLGAALIRSRTLPFEGSEVSNTAEVRNVQDYMSIEWPVVQMTYDQSTYWFGTLVHYAPKWSGMLIGLS